jgi:2',3'-cyclic-nucleotide 2'-phosphodiesterase (5'-nucleotidase family)
MQPRPFALATAAWVLIAASPVRADDAADTAALQKEIRALQATVQALAQRVAELEARTNDSSPHIAAAPNTQAITGTAAEVAAQKTEQAAAPAPVVPAGAAYMSPEAALRSNWSQVTQGMDQAAVTQLLGAPSLKTTLDGRTVWYYAYPGTGRGSVFFTDAGKVSSRQSPFGLGW